MEKPSTKKPMNILKTMVFLNNFMKKGDRILKPGDNWKVNINTTFRLDKIAKAE